MASAAKLPSPREKAVNSKRPQNLDPADDNSSSPRRVHHRILASSVPPLRCRRAAVRAGRLQFGRPAQQQRTDQFPSAEDQFGPCRCRAHPKPVFATSVGLGRRRDRWSGRAQAQNRRRSRWCRRSAGCGGNIHRQTSRPGLLSDVLKRFRGRPRGSYVVFPCRFGCHHPQLFHGLVRPARGPDAPSALPDRPELMWSGPPSLPGPASARQVRQSCFLFQASVVRRCPFFAPSGCRTSGAWTAVALRLLSLTPSSSVAVAGMRAGAAPTRPR